MDDEDLLAEDRELEEREECIQDVLELIVERVNAHLEAAELQGKVVGYAVREAVKDALAVVDMTFVERESSATRGASVAEDTRGSWEPDDEPVPAAVDAWARGAVPARRRQRTPAQDAKAQTKQQQVGALQQRNNSRIGSFSIKSGGENKKLAPSKELPKPKVMKVKLTPEAAEREQRLREEIDSRRAVQELQRLQIEKDKEEFFQLEVLQKELKGKEYGYDHKGQVVVLNKLDPERLPAFAVGLKVSVSSENQDGFEDDGAKKNDIGVKSKKLNAVDYIEQEKSGQPRVMDTMQVAMGVTLREGGGAKAGPPLMTTKQHMSRKDFMDLVGRQEVAAESSVKSRASENKAGWGFEDATGSQASMDRTVLPDPNVALLSAADWGINPPSAMKERPYLPPTQIPKAKSTSLEQSVGKGLSRYPRSRPFSKTSTTTTKGGSFGASFESMEERGM
mmetsp:Transcript_7395/g.18818  ORF Transcript_7395/g.18818 Transcript_7395/m.18818 type:complete len:451 (-) Transcript_7395:684-2036(-)